MYKIVSDVIYFDLYHRMLVLGNHLHLLMTFEDYTKQCHYFSFSLFFQVLCYDNFKTSELFL